MKTWFAYHLDPIDFGWEYLPTIAETEARSAAFDQTKDEFESNVCPAAQFTNDLRNAYRLARDEGWEGDFRDGEEPRVLWLPIADGFKYAFVWKQDNNGSTFVVSPVKLPWLSPVIYD
jgi:hypothetical protein